MFQAKSPLMLRNSLKNQCIVKRTHFSEMRVAKAASLALMLQESAEPSLLFLRACIAMILQMLRTGRGQVIKGLSPCCSGKQKTVIRNGWVGVCRESCYLVLTFVCAHRSWEPWVLCARCLMERAQSAAPSRHDQTLDNGQSSPQPTATDLGEKTKHLIKQCIQRQTIRGLWISCISINYTIKDLKYLLLQKYQLTKTMVL